MPMTYNQKKEYLKSYPAMTAALKRLESRKKFFPLTPAEEQQAEELRLRLQKISEEISLMRNPLFKELLTRRYVSQTPLCKVGEDLGYSARHIQRLHRAAVNEFEVL